jgi:hypothetical protein
MQRSTDEGEHRLVDTLRVHLRDYVGLEIGDQLRRIRVAGVAAVAQLLEQALQQKKVAEGQRLIMAGRRHVTRHARERGKDLLRRRLAVAFDIIVERRRPALGDRARDPPRMRVDRR